MRPCMPILVPRVGSVAGPAHAMTSADFTTEFDFWLLCFELDELAVDYCYDPVGNCRKRRPVRDDDDRNLLLESEEATGQHPIASVVKRAIGLIENEEARLARDGSCDHDALQETRGQRLRGGISEPGLVAPGQSIDVVLKTDQARCRSSCIDALAIAKHGEIVKYRAPYGRDLMVDHSKGPTSACSGLRSWRVIDQYLADLRVQLPHREPRSCRLANSIRPRNGDDFPRIDQKVRSLEHRNHFALVRKRNVVECDPRRERLTCFDLCLDSNILR